MNINPSSSDLTLPNWTPGPWTRRLRLLVGLSVTLLWLAVMGFIVMRETGRTQAGLQRMGVSSELLMVSWADYEHWMWIERNNQRIGATQLAIRRVRPKTTAGDRPTDASPLFMYVMDTRTHVPLSMFGMTIPIDLAIRAEMNQVFELETLEGRLDIEGYRIFCQAFTENGQLFYRVMAEDSLAENWMPNRQATEENRRIYDSWLPAFLRMPDRDLCGRTPLPEPILLREVVAPILTQVEHLRPGQKWTTRVDSPFMGGSRGVPIHVTVEGREGLAIDGKIIPSWRLTEWMESLESTAWYDNEGRLLRRQMPGGLALVRSDRRDVVMAYPALTEPMAYLPLDRVWIKEHLRSELIGRTLADLLPALPMY
jgi:hypothetical protein